MTPNTPDHFTAIQKVCCDYIEMIIRNTSEMWYAAGWATELDYHLYAEVTRNESKYLEDYILKNLRTCSDEINGWIAWDNDINHPRFYTHEEMVTSMNKIIENRKTLTEDTEVDIISIDESDYFI